MNELKKLSSSNLELSNLVLALVEEYAAFLHYRLNALQFQSAQERYKELLKHESEMLQRVSLTHIASYLGVSRETLSRMRAKK
jgi:CRP-like cAMP-binding protein